MKTTSSESTAGERLFVQVSERDHIQGTLHAPKMLVEYGDYECPHCRAAHEVVRALQWCLGDQLCFAYRNFPLADMHPHAEQAAEAAEAAGAQHKFWEMHNLLFETEDPIDAEHLSHYAAAIELDMRRFVSDLRVGAYFARVRDDFRTGVRSGVTGTPTFFINNVRFDESPDFETLFPVLA